MASEKNRNDVLINPPTKQAKVDNDDDSNLMSKVKHGQNKANYRRNKCTIYHQCLFVKREKDHLLPSIQSHQVCSEK